MAEHPIDKFKKEFEKYHDIWKSIEIRAIFALKGDQWIALKVMAYLRDTEQQRYDHKIVFDDANLKAIIEFKKIEFLDDFLDQMMNGKVIIGDIQGKFPAEDIGNSFGFLTEQSRTGRHPEPLLPHFMTYLSLGSVGQYVDENEINRLLYSYGYRGGLQELSNAKIGAPVGGGYNVYFAIVAALPLLLSAEYESHYVKVQIRCSETINPVDLSLQYELYGKTESDIIQIDNVTFTAQDKKLIDGILSIEKIIAVTGEISSGRLLLFYREIRPPVDAFNLFIGGAKANIPNILNVLESVGKIQDKGKGYETVLSSLIQWLGLSGKALDSDRFEIAIWTLLTLSGLQTIHMGKSLGKGFDIQGIDLIAFQEQSKKIILASCTIDNRLSSNIEPLLQILNTVKSKMTGYDVKAAIFAPIEKNDITIGSYSDAHQSGIALVLRPEINEILNVIKDASADSSTRVINLIWQNNLESFFGDDNLASYRLWSQDFGSKTFI